MLQLDLFCGERHGMYWREDLLSTSKSEEEKGNGADKFPYDSDGMSAGRWGQRTKKSAQRPIDRGVGSFGIHRG